MDDRQALAIVTALANGANPQTGELFPPDSPYQRPEVIRALFAAQRALETGTQSPAVSGNVSGNLPVRGERDASDSMPPDRVQKRSATSANAGKPWSADEDKQLLAAFDANQSLVDIARAHGRTAGGVRARLEKHGRLEPSPATRWPVAEIKEAAVAHQQHSRSVSHAQSNGRE